MYSSTLDSIIAQSYYNDTLFEVLDKLIFGDVSYEETKIKENSRLNMIEVPEALSGNCTYENFFYHCTKLTQDNKPVIPIALYRNSNASILGNDTPYIITNPEKGTLLLSGDIIFVLGDSPEQAEKREAEYINGINSLQSMEMVSGVKVPTQDLDEEMLDNVDDEVILQLVKKNCLKQQKERK